MGRSKPIPKRRRVEEEEAQSRAIDELRGASQEDVEMAAAEAMRSTLLNWERLDDGDSGDEGNGGGGSPLHEKDQEGKEGGSSNALSRRRGGELTERLPPEFDGLARCAIEDESDANAFEELHDAIKRRASAWTSWSGSQSDRRKRAFGFLPLSLGAKDAVRAALDVSTPDADETSAAEERPRNARAMVILADEDVPPRLSGALDRLLERLRPSAPPNLRRYLSLSHLVAAQPNLHCGQPLLPGHVDHPDKDGFGIIIVTISIRGSAAILIETSDRSRRTTFSLPPRHAYILSGLVRNQCTHGVLADVGSCQRESLNLRFGLHGRTAEDPPSSDVLKHWQDGV